MHNSERRKENDERVVGVSVRADMYRVLEYLEILQLLQLHYD